MKTREVQIRQITLVGALVNIALTVIKILVGVIGGSAAMIADGVHSLSDLLSDVVVLVFSHISSQGKDRGHAFGHGKFETLATLIVSVILVVVGAVLMADGVESILGVVKGQIIPEPSQVVLWVALISIISKEILYRCTLKVGLRVNSPVVIANAWHHRSDAFSSIGALIGIGGAIFLGNKWTILDPVASCVISIFIMVVAIRMAAPALAELLESSLPAEVEDEIVQIALSVDGVDDIHALKTRRNGISFIIDAHIVVNPDMTVEQAHNIVTNVERAIMARYSSETQINIHVEPRIESE